MNATAKVRGLGRFWRVGVAVLIVLMLPLGWIIIGSKRGGSTTIAYPAAPSPTNLSAAASTTAPAAAPTAARPAPAASVAAAPAAAGTTANRSASSGGTSNDAAILNAPLPPQTIDQKIIRTAMIQITAKDVTGTQNSIWNLATELGGNVLTSNTSGTDDNIRSEIAIRVPTDRYKDAMDRIRGYAFKVEKEQSSAQDVTEDYVDLQARQRNLEASVLQYQALLTKATTVDDTLKVQAQLNNAQSDLERIKGKLNYYDQRTAFSTISTTILPVPPPAKPVPVTPVAHWSLSHSLQEAWNRSVNGLQNVADAVIAIVIGGWWIEIPLGLAIFFLVRRERGRRPVMAPVIVPAAGGDAHERAE